MRAGKVQPGQPAKQSMNDRSSGPDYHVDGSLQPGHNVAGWSTKRAALGLGSMLDCSLYKLRSQCRGLKLGSLIPLFLFVRAVPFSKGQWRGHGWRLCMFQQERKSLGGRSRLVTCSAAVAQTGSCPARCGISG
ncbi:hypothetical protein HPB50_005013 [Hyalomma asiaticum]|uniref:Uncharacterized protein n=1 Tax=Hyalomma asiaticum TaxID=266040 RepID=A0ACB7SK78_HYAAI|nr:hypothetical protein HPB50_005013 [Hyalomma asiaticum]